MSKSQCLEALKQLALLGGLEGSVEIASGELAQLLETSQQTASRRLIEMANDGFVRREMGVRKQRIAITDQGRGVLQAEHALYQRLFESPGQLEIRGTVTGGLGEGRYYLSRAGYQQAFKQLLGWEAFPGTLNLELRTGEANKLRTLKRHPMHTIEGFEAEGRTFGGVLCFPAIVGDQQIEAAVVLPNRSHYRTTLELIAPVELREALPCVDGDTLTVQVRMAA